MDESTSLPLLRSLAEFPKYANLTQLSVLSNMPAHV